MKSLSIRERNVRGVTIVDLEGSVTLGESNRKLHDALKQLVRERKCDVVLNLAKVTKIDSSGLGEIIAGFTTVRAIGGTLKLLNVPDDVADLMMITKLVTVFDMYEDEWVAVDSFEDEADRKAAAGSASTQDLPNNFRPDIVANSSIH